MLYTITGPSGSGKSTLVRMLLEGYPERVRKVVTSTTRKPRRGEQDGIDYHFEPLPEGGFDAWKSYHTASAEFDGNFYGIGTADYDGLFGGNTDSIVILEPSGAREMKSLFPDDVRTVYVRIGAERAARHMKKRHSRYKKRQKADIGAGLFDENGYDYVLNNDEDIYSLIRRFLDLLPDVQIAALSESIDSVMFDIRSSGGRVFREPVRSVDEKSIFFVADIPDSLKDSFKMDSRIISIGPVEYFSPS